MSNPVKETFVDKFVRNGNVAVLYSGFQGLGFSTAMVKEFEQAGATVESVCQNPLIVWHVLNDDHVKATELIRELYGIHFHASALKVAWVGLGCYFHIHEIDGFECVTAFDRFTLFTA
jgi:hypothetical protein